ncbi:ABC transporter substrate-binding protein [Persicobacter diffluens]|uniref:ABC transporter substrate-binding protein n=1 Tax=Persicobacter diffluens TaxID=981 RepID=A0AAN4W1I2_9BACT|nr:hypothetical protein PEDI_34500 [Persicobacter diffluens]
MSDKVTLRGITWDHSRGFTSIVATAQRFHELNPEVEIVWEKRSLQAFADEPLNELAARYDLLVIDHPWAGFAARTGEVVALNEVLSPAFIEDQRVNSVGHSFESYQYDGKQWALAIDAATPVAAARMDLFENAGRALPKTYEDLLALAEEGKVAVPGIPQDTLMNFYMICSTLGEDVCLKEDEVISRETGLKALELLRALGKNMSAESYEANPIRVFEMMTQTDQYWYCPFAYGYTNYSRRGYARKSLKFMDMVSLEGQPLISTIGGTGLAISAQCKNVEIAAKYAEFVGCPETQSGIFFDNGGQPGHRKSWLNTHTNAVTQDFFKDTLPTLDRAFLRPRYFGHMYFQDRAGAPIREFMMNGGNAEELLSQLNDLYKESKQQEQLV